MESWPQSWLADQAKTQTLGEEPGSWDTGESLSPLTCSEATPCCAALWDFGGAGLRLGMSLKTGHWDEGISARNLL